MRAGELQGLTWDHVELTGKFPHLRVFRQLKPNKAAGTVRMAAPKRDSQRVIPLHRAAAAALSAWWHVGWRHYVGRDPKPADFVFPAPDGSPAWGRPFTPWHFRRDLAALGVASVHGCGTQFDFHAARRTFLTLLTDAGFKDEGEQLAGHKGKTVADRHYIARDPQRFSRAVASLPLGEVPDWIIEMALARGDAAE
jgi:integrase